MSIRLLTVALVTVCLGFLASCTISRGTYVDPNALSQVKKGVTTKAEVVQLLGYPLQQTSDQTGKTTFIYFHEKGDPAALNPQPNTITLIGTTSKETQTTIIRFDPAGVVESVNYSNITDVKHPVFGAGARAPSQGIGPREERGLVQ